MIEPAVLLTVKQSPVTSSLLASSINKKIILIVNVTAVFLQIGKGILRAMIINKDARLDVVPVDYVIDTIVCAAWHVTLHCDDKPKVYNCTSNASSFK